MCNSTMWQRVSRVTKKLVMCMIKFLYDKGFHHYGITWKDLDFEVYGNTLMDTWIYYGESVIKKFLENKSIFNIEKDMYEDALKAAKRYTQEIYEKTLKELLTIEKNLKLYKDNLLSLYRDLKTTIENCIRYVLREYQLEI